MSKHETDFDEPLTREEEQAFEAFLKNHPDVLTMRALDEAWDAFEAAQGKAP